MPKLPEVQSLRELFSYSPAQFARAGALGQDLVGPFQDYLIRGGFPQIAQIESIPIAQKLLREDIVDKVLKRDMTAPMACAGFSSSSRPSVSLSPRRRAPRACVVDDLYGESALTHD